MGIAIGDKVDKNITVYITSSDNQIFMCTDSQGTQFDTCTKLNTTGANLNNPAQIAIKNNQPLLNYIRALINIARENLSIINEGRTSHKIYQKTPTYFQHLGLRRYTVPESSTPSAYRFYAESLVNTPQIYGTANTLYNNIISGTVSNAVFVDPYASGLMIGGAGNMGAVKSGFNIESQVGVAHLQLYQSLLAGLKEVGMELDGADALKIGQSIEKLSKLEMQLGKLFSHLKSMIDLARIFGLSSYDYDEKTIQKLKLKDIRSNADMQNFISSMISSLKKNINTNLNLQQSMNFDLMHRIFPNLANTIANSGSSVAPSKASDQLVAISE